MKNLPFQPGTLVLVAGYDRAGHFIGAAADNPDQVEVTIPGVGRVQVPLTDVAPLPGPGQQTKPTSQRPDMTDDLEGDGFGLDQ